MRKGNTNAAAPKKAQPRLSKVTKKNIARGYLFLAPNLIGFICFTLIPVIAAFALAFTDWNAFGAPHFVGLENFRTMFGDANFKASFWNNMKYTLLYVPGTIILALLFALALNKKIVAKGAFRVIYFLPYITSMVAVSMIWRMLYNGTYGPINAALKSLGFTNVPNWLADPKWAMYAIIIMCIWKNYGYYMVIFLAGLTGVDVTLYEAAQLDGANSWQKFWNVTFPQLSPTTFFVTITCIISSFKVFDAINVMTEGGPGRSTYVLVYTIYTEAFKNYRFGYASSVALVLFSMILLVTLIQWRGQKKWVEYM